MLPSLKYLDDADADGNEVDESDAEDGQNGTLDEEGSDEDGNFSFSCTGKIIFGLLCMSKILIVQESYFSGSVMTITFALGIENNWHETDVRSISDINVFLGYRQS